jgi:hypothetical protein
MEASFPAGTTYKSLLSEDWVAFIIGGAVILATLLIAGLSPGFKFKAPLYLWATTKDLFTKVLAPGNLLLLALIGGILFLLAIIAVGLLGGSPRRFVTGFVVVYLLGIFSLIVAGSAQGRGDRKVFPECADRGGGPSPGHLVDL